MRAASSPPSLVTLVFATALSVLTLNMFLPSLARMAGDFQVDYALVNFSVAGYLAVSAVLQLIMGPLSDRFGRRPILLICMSIFVAGLHRVRSGRVDLGLPGFSLATGRCCGGAGFVQCRYPAICTHRMRPPVNWAMSRWPWRWAPNARADARWCAGQPVWLARGLCLVFHTWGRGAAVTLGGYGGDQHQSLLDLLGTAKRIPAPVPRPPVLGATHCVPLFRSAGFTASLLVRLWWQRRGFDLSPAMLGLGIGIITGGFMGGELHHWAGSQGAQG